MCVCVCFCGPLWCDVSSILDDVIRGVSAANPTEQNKASSRFSADIKLYIAVSVATGLFGSIRSLCFSLVGSKISNDVRNQLYTSILRQDVAFFDSITSGELTSRLARDTEGMVSPMQVRQCNMQQTTTNNSRQQTDMQAAPLSRLTVLPMLTPPLATAHCVALRCCGCLSECARYEPVQLPAIVGLSRTTAASRLEQCLRCYSSAC